MCHLIFSLWLLPYAGAQAGFAMHGEQQHRGAALVENVSSISEQDSCAGKPAPNSHTHKTMNPANEACPCADCCKSNPCTSECANGCGHCVAQGHGCSIPVLNTLSQPVQLHGESLSFLAQPYSYFGPQPTPPPNIA